MDRVLKSGALPRPAGWPGAPPQGEKATPPEAPAPMPTQSLRHWNPGRHPRTGGRDLLARAGRRGLVLGGATLIAALAINEMRMVLNVEGLTLLEILVLVLFALNTVWIALPAMMSLVGFFIELSRRWSSRPSADGAAGIGRTAIVMPLHNEDPTQIGAAVDAMASDLVARGYGGDFDFFLLSDTTDGDIALAEQEVVWALKGRFAHAIAIYYRRRLRNTAHKSGNIRELCERWGAAYDHLLVLDADSLMDAAAIIELARRMRADPRAGLIQTTPRLVGGTTLVARVQQFAGRVYGPPLAAGLGWWTGSEGNFWGHNAIIRTRAFMEAAGLPELPGRPPLGGPILSHDFVEAALLRRAGWAVRLADDLSGSYESCPATLIDLSIRDRRWCQGNLQHLRLLTARGLHWVSRLHLLTGVLSFLSSPLWLLFLLAALALGVQNEFALPEYFGRQDTLFPIWPRIDPERAERLFFLSLGVLLAPKVLGLLSFATHWRRLRASGGLLLLPSFLCELLLSALLAPILMLFHCGFVASILAGRDGGWRPQRRGDDGAPWTQVAYRHRWHVVSGVALVAAAHFVSWEMVAWVTPAALGMVAAIPLSLLTGSAVVGRWLRRAGVLRTPEEGEVPPIYQRAGAALASYREVVAGTPDLPTVLADPERLRRHLAMTDRPPPRAQEPIHMVEATAVLKVNAARHLEEAVARLSPQERAYVQADPELLEKLARLPRLEAEPPLERTQETPMAQMELSSFARNPKGEPT